MNFSQAHFFWFFSRPQSLTALPGAWSSRPHPPASHRRNLSSEETRWQKNAVRKMKLARFAPNGGGGVCYISAPDISAILFDKTRKFFLRDPQAGPEPFRGAYAPPRVAVGALAGHVFAYDTLAIEPANRGCLGSAVGPPSAFGVPPNALQARHSRLRRGLGAS